MDNMVEDLKTEHSESKHEEETAQKDYEDLMSASQKTRSKNAESITEKESAKSEWSEKIENAIRSMRRRRRRLRSSRSTSPAFTPAATSSWRTTVLARPRTNEIEGLKNAKAVLSGANFA